MKSSVEFLVAKEGDVLGVHLSRSVKQCFVHHLQTSCLSVDKSFMLPFDLQIVFWIYQEFYDKCLQEGCPIPLSLKYDKKISSPLHLHLQTNMNLTSFYMHLVLIKFKVNHI